MDCKSKETTETNFNSALQDDDTLFSSHTVNTLSLIDLEKKINNNYNEVTDDTTSIRKINKNHINRQSNFNPINTLFGFI